MPSLKLDAAQDLRKTEEEQPYQIIEPTSGWAALDLKQIWLFRDLLLSLAIRDVKLRYRQTALGVIWVVLQPLIAAGVFTFVFGIVANLPSDGIPPFVFSYAGLLGWNIFSNTFTKVSGVLVQNSHLISKVYFPRLILPLSTVYSTLVDLTVAFSVMVVLMVIYKIALGWSIILLPVWIILTLLLALGLGLCASALTVFFRDVQYIIPVIINILLYASPVAYSLTAAMDRLKDNAPAQYALGRTVYLANPLSGLLEAFRWSLLGTTTPPWGSVIYASVCSVLLFVGGAFAFKKMERKFVDVI
jgi:lipopolysaccharide transport system permease protein